MKILKPTVLVVVLLCFINTSLAQQRYQIHVDNVKPAMVKEYEKTAKKFVEACEKYNPQGPWITASSDNLKYMYISPMDNFADLDKPLYTDMAKEMGDDWSNLFMSFDKCYDSHTDFVITLVNNLSYMPEGMSQMQEGQNYRKWYYLYYTPENSQKMFEAMKGVKELFVSKNSKEYYRIYRSGFGCPENFYLVAVSAKDELDAAMTSKANDELLGDEWKEVFGKVMDVASRFDQISGWMRPELSYSPK
ncbi:hypothetical protein [Yeosuana marina]|uniref:hypothetical protein n=1 Tax=Yeosuana marina TaxID=1565536 RepID=UPI0030EF42D5|tara:strand:- start:854 stop:1597 length:744 start_codon:yes stop_codon:yes gene_type:complete